jgi:phosphoglycerate dehydrogenase-like enzyme
VNHASAFLRHEHKDIKDTEGGGGLVDEPALIRAWRQRRIAAAALDVISRERPPAGLPIMDAAKELDHLLVTPTAANPAPPESTSAV